MTTAPKPARGGSKGSFWISLPAIEILISSHATATDIAAYLILARFTDETGQYSTAGMQAIYQRIGIGQDVAKRAVKRLSEMHRNKPGRAKAKGALIHSAETWTTITDKDLPHGLTELSKIRWVLNTFEADANSKVWMSNELVDGIGTFTKPMQRLKRAGDVAARILLLSYQNQNLERFGGINPANMFYTAYSMESIFNDLRGGYDLWHGKEDHSHVYTQCSLPTLGIESWPNANSKKEELISKWFRAMKALDSAGFIYQVVSVLDRPHSDQESQVIFELDAKTRHGYKPKGEGGLGGLTARLAGMLDRGAVTDAMGRFNGKYAAIVPAGIETHIVGIWRLRFRVSNPKNYGVRGAWARIHRSQEEAVYWIKDVARQYEFTDRMGFSESGEGETTPHEQEPYTSNADGDP